MSIAPAELRRIAGTHFFGARRGGTRAMTRDALLAAADEIESLHRQLKAAVDEAIAVIEKLGKRLEANDA